MLYALDDKFYNSLLKKMVCNICDCIMCKNGTCGNEWCACSKLPEEFTACVCKHTNICSMCMAKHYSANSIYNPGLDIFKTRCPFCRTIGLMSELPDIADNESSAYFSPVYGFDEI